MAHEPAYASVAVWKRMDVVQAMMSGSNRNDAGSPSKRLKPIPRFKIFHERRHALARRRNVAPDGHVVFSVGSPRTRLHSERMMIALDGQHRFRRTFVKLTMQPTNEVSRRWFRQPAVDRHLVDGLLDMNVCRS